MYSCHCFIRSSPLASWSSSSSGFVIPNLCFYSKENSVEDGKESNKIAWFHPSLVWCAKIIIYLTTAKCLFNVCRNKRWKKHMGIFPKPESGIIIVVILFAFILPPMSQKNCYHWYLWASDCECWSGLELCLIYCINNSVVKGSNLKKIHFSL